MSEFRFANVGWIHALWIVLAITVVLVALELRGRSALDRFLSRLMQSRLVQRTSPLRRITALALAVLAMVLLVFAMMRPQWGMTLRPSIRVDSQIMVCLDVSKSMLAEDVAPNRLNRAKVELDSLLGLMDEGQQVGLIAFAGKATVLCPMTTDFGFLRLILADTDPWSVGLGGTKIGQALQKAIDGFRTAGDINRLILLITDGEDHDSYPLQAAKEAREKGIKIVCIGFGDEAGSRIEITDPKTGGRVFLKDRNGQEVISRLDGETLRDIAMETSGAYIPAGTGALDLESIYRTHIANLLKGSVEAEQRIVRNEAYQWFVIAAILLLMMSLLCLTPLTRRGGTAQASSIASAAGSVQAIALLCAVACALQPASAPAQSAAAPSAGSNAGQPAPATAPSDSAPPSVGDGAVAAQPGGEASADDLDDSLSPREVYNRAVALVGSDPDRAERYLNRARRDAGADGELRYRALYNLGWVEVNRADEKLEGEPQLALQHLQQAANRFREAVRVRPDSPEARHNLEVVSRRILELTDSLNQRDPRDLATRLDELIAQLRVHQGQLQALVQRVAGEPDQANAAGFRQDFRQLGVAQRQIIADTQRFYEDAAKEVDALKQKKDEDLSQDDKVRAVQLGNMLVYVESGLQRLNQARSLTRRLQGNRAFRRWSSGLSDAKRARDQLRHPVEVLGQIIADASEMVGLTRTLARSASQLVPQDQTEQPPAWLDREYLQDVQAATLDRTSELEKVFSSLVAAYDSADQPPSTAASQTQEPDRATRKLMQNMRQALPSVKTADSAFQQASEQLKTGTLDNAFASQSEALAALTEAWEWFFDVRRLIEVMYRDETLVRQAIDGVRERPDLARQIALSLLEAQRKNVQRADRLDGMFDEQMAELRSTAESAGAKTPLGPPLPGQDNPPDQTSAELQKFDMAKKLLAASADHLGQSLEPLTSLSTQAAEDIPPATAAEDAADETPEARTEPSTVAPEKSGAESNSEEPGATSKKIPASPQNERGDTADPRLVAVETSVDQALDNLEQLRRLFFSLIEHLRDTAQRQADLNDETTQVGAEPLEKWAPEQFGPLAARQNQLQAAADQIGSALKQQGEQAATAATAPTPAAPTGPPSKNAPQDAAAAAERLSHAAELVTTAAGSMKTAADGLKTGATGNAPQEDQFKEVLDEQRKSLEKLLEALQLLDESNPQQNQDQQNQGQNQQQQQQQEQQDQQRQDQRKDQQAMSANQLLQLIRDREAERRRDKKDRSVTSGAGVDKDW